MPGAVGRQPAVAALMVSELAEYARFDALVAAEAGRICLPMVSVPAMVEEASMVVDASIMRPPRREEEQRRLEPVPILSPEQYRFARFAVDVAASLGERERPAAARSSSLSRIHAALRLFEELPPPR
jgi:hypothetical protein